MHHIYHIRHIIAKFEGSSCSTTKVTAFFWKVPIAIFVNPGQCPCKSIKMENFECILTSKINLYHKNLKIRKNSKFLEFSQKNDILRDFGTKFPIGTHIFDPILYKVPLPSFTLQKNSRLYRFPFFRYEGFTLTYNFHLNHSIFA